MIQEFDTNVLDLVKQKGFYPHEYVTDFETFEEKLPSKEKFPWWVKRVVIKIMNMMLKFGMNLKWRQWKIIITCFIHKCDVLLLAHTFGNFRNHSLKKWWIKSKLLFECTSFKMVCYAKYDKI